MLVGMEIKHHVHAVAVAAEIFHVGLGQHVGFRENDRVAFAPLQEFEDAQHVVLLHRCFGFGTFGCNHERHRSESPIRQAESKSP
jgi:hypothetical protein